MVLDGLLAVLVQAVLTVSAVPVPAVPDARVVAPSTDGTQAEAATGFGSVPPTWLGTRVLPDDPATGHGEVRPTPPVCGTGAGPCPTTYACSRDAATPPRSCRRHRRA